VSLAASLVKSCLWFVWPLEAMRSNLHVIGIGSGPKNFIRLNFKAIMC